MPLVAERFAAALRCVIVALKGC